MTPAEIKDSLNQLPRLYNSSFQYPLIGGRHSHRGASVSTLARKPTTLAADTGVPSLPTPVSTPNSFNGTNGKRSSAYKASLSDVMSCNGSINGKLERGRYTETEASAAVIRTCSQRVRMFYYEAAPFASGTFSAQINGVPDTWLCHDMDECEMSSHKRLNPKFCTVESHGAPPPAQFGGGTVYDHYPADNDDYGFLSATSRGNPERRTSAARRMPQGYQSYSFSGDTDNAEAQSDDYSPSLKPDRGMSNRWHAMMSRSTVAGSQGFSFQGYPSEYQEDDDDDEGNTQYQAYDEQTGQGDPDPEYALEDSASPWYEEGGYQRASDNQDGEQYPHSDQEAQEQAAEYEYENVNDQYGTQDAEENDAEYEAGDPYTVVNDEHDDPDEDPADENDPSALEAEKDNHSQEEEEEDGEDDARDEPDEAAYFTAFGNSTSIEQDYPEYPNYSRYQTARSGDTVDEDRRSVRRTDSIDRALQSSQREVLSRYNSKEYQQDVESSGWNRYGTQEQELEDIQEEVGESEAQESEEPEEEETNVQELQESDQDEEDGETASRTLAAEQLEPYSLQQIDANVDVVYVPNKGRCVFAKKTFRPGDIIFIETPTLVAIPSIAPELWERLQELNAEAPFDLPPVWHLAALYALTQLSRNKQNVILDKWVPEPNRPPGKDVKRVLMATQLKVDPYRYERFLQAWRYNSFGHHVETDGLVLYNRISMIAHDCSATATWHYGDDDAFVLRARQFIPQGDEITISYIGDDDLLKATHIRQEKLSSWLFTCQCSRCQDSCDGARGFRCPCCGAGTTFFRTEKAPDDTIAEGTTSATPCTLCNRTPSPKTIQKYLIFEDAYIARLDETDKTDLPDAELVYSEAQRVFNQHWVLHALDTVLFDAYRDASHWEAAATHQQHRIQYVSQVMPKASYSLAWLYEELGDMYSNTVSTSFHSRSVPITGYQKNILAAQYETAMNILFVLCGSQHTYTLAAHRRLSQVFNAPAARST